jgi:hypothetical protein
MYQLMKKIIIILLCISNLLCCKKDIGNLEPTIGDKILACVNAKELPNITKGDIWIEGEMNGKYFSMSKSANLWIQNPLQSFLAGGYKKDYADIRIATTPAFIVFQNPSDTTVSKFHYYLDINFPYFQGDSIAYLNYFSQFQKGKEFKYRKNSGSIQEGLVPETVEITIDVFECDANTSNRLTSSQGVDETGSYFRITEVKEYKSANGQVYRRDVTMEFDVKLGLKETTLVRIKNGRLFFSY